MESDKDQARWLIKCVSDGRMTGGMAAEIEDYCFARRTEIEALTSERDQLRAEVRALKERKEEPMSKPIFERVIDKMRRRAAAGLETYGEPLRAHNGRNAMQDFQDEMLDAAHYAEQHIEEVADLRAEVARLRAELRATHEDNAMGAHSMANTTVDATARAEAAEGRAAGLYRALCDAVRASGGVANDGISDTFLILGVPAEMAARKKAQEAAEALLRDLATILNPHESYDATKIAGWARDTVERAGEADRAEHTAAGLRRALEEINDAICVTRPSDIANGVLKAFQLINAALAASPDEHERRLKAEALEEVSKELRTAIDHVMCGCYNESDIGGLQLALAKVAQLGKSAVDCLSCSYADIDGKKVVYQRCENCEAEADRLEAANGR